MLQKCFTITAKHNERNIFLMLLFGMHLDLPDLCCSFLFARYHSRKNIRHMIAAHNMMATTTPATIPPTPSLVPPLLSPLLSPVLGVITAPPVVDITALLLESTAAIDDVESVIAAIEVVGEVAEDEAVLVIAVVVNNEAVGVSNEVALVAVSPGSIVVAIKSSAVIKLLAIVYTVAEQL